jgi:hypothetical protein
MRRLHSRRAGEALHETERVGVQLPVTHTDDAAG